MFFVVVVCLFFVFFTAHLLKPGASRIAQLVKNLPAVWETWVQFLGQEVALEKKMATHSSILAWRIPGTGEPVGLVYGVAQSRTREDILTQPATCF